MKVGDEVDDVVGPRGMPEEDKGSRKGCELLAEVLG